MDMNGARSMPRSVQFLPSLTINGDHNRAPGCQHAFHMEVCCVRETIRDVRDDRRSGGLHVTARPAGDMMAGDMMG